MRRTLFALAAGGVVSSPALALDLAVTGAVSLPVSAGRLVAGAGSDLVGLVDSGAGDVRLDVALADDASDRWRVEVRRSDAAWDEAMRVWIRRTGDGDGTGSVSDGLTWIEVGPTNSIFFEGSGDRSDVPIQVRVSGLSLGLPPATSLTALQYTLVDIL